MALKALFRNLFRRVVEFFRDPYRGAREQADREIQAIEDWVKAGAPEGGLRKVRKGRAPWL